MTQSRPLICARPGFWRVVGLAFCIIWAAALVMFPYHKGTVSGYIPVAVGLFVGGMLCFTATIRTRVWSNRRLRPLVLLLLMTFVLHLFYEVQSRYHISVISALVLIAAAGLAASPRTTGLASGGPE